MKPDYLAQGELARLFPVLATTSKEGRTTSILLACLSRIEELARELIGPLGQRIGSRSQFECYTEVIFKGQKIATKDRPDGLLIVRIGGREWRALIEAKIGNSELNVEQIEKYRTVAKEYGLDCVITISNQFATRPENHPLEAVRKGRSSIPVFHWSWMYILTTADLLLNNQSVSDSNQQILLQELRRFLSHESAGVKGFERMPSEWSELNKLVSAGGRIHAKSNEAIAVMEAWHQETKDLSLILSRQTETAVTEKLSRKHRTDPMLRQRDELAHLESDNQLFASLDVPGAAAPIDVTADLARKTIDVGMTMRAPEDRKSSKARLNWLTRQVKDKVIDGLQVRLQWPGRSTSTQFPFSELIANPSIIEEGKAGLQVHRFDIFISRTIGSRFAQQSNFIGGLEALVPEFYATIGQNLTMWQAQAPKIREEREAPEEVSVQAIANQSNENDVDAQ